MNSNQASRGYQAICGWHGPSADGLGPRLAPNTSADGIGPRLAPNTARLPVLDRHIILSVETFYSAGSLTLLAGVIFGMLVISGTRYKYCHYGRLCSASSPRFSPRLPLLPQLPPTHSVDIKQMAEPGLEATIKVDSAVVCADAHPPSRRPAHEAAADCS